MILQGGGGGHLYPSGSVPVVYVTFVQRGLSFRDGNFIELESTVTHIYFLNLFTILNPYKPSVLFMGHMQAVQTRIRRRRAASDQGLRCLVT